ncbi:MAG: hypothetical protein P8J20_08670, partial [Novosphingobium sp.]|nr:hypothetical protein [Novosphingobium sp.]
IAALAATGIVTQAAREIGASLEALYALRHRKGAEGFSAAWEEAIDRGISRLEDCALERAIVGEERPVVSHGKLLGHWQHYDTQLLTFLLRQRRPKRWNAGGAHFANLKPGHPVYERLKREWQIETEKIAAAKRPAIQASVHAKVEAMARHRLAELIKEKELEEGEE